VTSNLFNLLGKLRVPDENQLLWIDAIYVNQEDLDERSEQVGLMRDIYRNVVAVLCAIGDEILYTREAFEMIYQISEISAFWASNLTMEDLDGIDKYKYLQNYLVEQSWKPLRNNLAGQVVWTS
jgi:hypothetical protein